MKKTFVLLSLLWLAVGCKSKKQVVDLNPPKAQNYDNVQPQRINNEITIAGATYSLDTSYGRVAIYSYDSIVNYEWKPGLIVRTISYVPRIDKIDTIKTIKQ